MTKDIVNIDIIIGTCWFINEWLRILSQSEIVLTYDTKHFSRHCDITTPVKSVAVLVPVDDQPTRIVSAEVFDFLYQNEKVEFVAS